MQMRRVLRWMLLIVSPLVSAEEWMVGTRISSLGLGVELGRPLGETVTGRIGVNLFSYTGASRESDIDYDWSVDLRSAGLIGDWHPGHTPFRFSAGLLYNANQADLAARSISGTYTINGVTYIQSDVGSLQGNLEASPVAPFLGVGWSRVDRRKGWSMSVDLGALYQGESEVSLDATCSPSLSGAQCANLQSDVAAEEVQLRNAVQEYRWYPVLSVGLQYRF